MPRDAPPRNRIQGNLDCRDLLSREHPSRGLPSGCLPPRDRMATSVLRVGTLCLVLGVGQGRRDAVAVPGCHLDAAVPTAAAAAAAISSPSAAAAEAAAAVSRSFLYEHLVHIVGVVLQHPVFSGEHAKHHWRQLPPVAGLQRQRLATKHTSARCQQPSITTASR